MKRILVYTCMFIVSQVAVAQWTFTTSVTKSGNCSGLDALGANLWAAIGKAAGQRNFPTKEQCEVARASYMGSYSDGGCTTRVTTSPCKGPAGTSGGVDVLGVGKGTSFYSTTGVDEIKNWSSDDARRRMGLDKEYRDDANISLSTGDSDFDNARMGIDPNKPFVSINMKEGGSSTIHSSDFENPELDFSSLNIDLKPVPNGFKTFDEEGWDLWRDGLKLGKDMGMFVYGLGKGATNSTVAVAGLLADLNINLYTEIYKAYKKSSMGEAYEAANPNNLYTEAAVFWGGKDYAIVGNIFYNSASATLDDFMGLVSGTFREKMAEVTMDEVRNKALTDNVSKKLWGSDKIAGVGSIAIDSFKFGGKVADYLNKKE